MGQPKPRSGRRRTAGALVVALVMTLSACTDRTPDVPQPSSASTGPAWRLVWSDDFDGAAGSLPSGKDWLLSTGIGYPGGARQWGTGEVETMTGDAANVHLDGAGHLAILPLRAGGGVGRWTSGRVETRRTDFAAAAGGAVRIEASLRMPDVTGAQAAGYWAAFWALGAPARPVGATNWPHIGEWDIMENVNGRDSVWHTLHCGTPVGGPCQETTGLGSGELPCSGCRAAFHTYAIEFDRSVSPEELRWYVDGRNTFTVRADRVDPATWSAANHHGFFVILNVAMGGSFPAPFGGGPTPATKPGVPMLVDRVAVLSTPGAG